MLTLTAAVVDDSRFARQAIMQTLKQSGLAHFSFVEAADGIQALEVLAANRVDIVFLDWNLPYMNGPEVVRQLRQDRKTTNIPVVMVTSERSMGKVMQALDESEVDGYVMKPFTADELRQRLSSLFDDLRKGDGRASTRKDKKKSTNLLWRLLGRE